MKKMSRQNDNRMTVREVAEVLGVHYDTVASHVKQLFPELVRNGVATYLNEVQVTAVKLEIQKSHNLRNTPKVKETKTQLEKALIIKQALLLQQEMIDELQKALTITTKTLTETRDLLGYRTAGLEMIQRIAESGGLIMSDRDDIADTYRRR